jgi:hypothetical protein
MAHIKAYQSILAFRILLLICYLLNKEGQIGQFVAVFIKIRMYLFPYKLNSYGIKIVYAL